MSEKNKTTELKDEELEKVAGGTFNGPYTFTAGEWYICKIGGFSNNDNPEHAFNVKVTTTCTSENQTVPCVEWTVARSYGILVESSRNENATPTAGFLLSGGGKLENPYGYFVEYNCVK